MTNLEHVVLNACKSVEGQPASIEAIRLRTIFTHDTVELVVNALVLKGFLGWRRGGIVRLVHPPEVG